MEEPLEAPSTPMEVDEEVAPAEGEASVGAAEGEDVLGEAKVVVASFRVVHGKQTHVVSISATDTVGNIKEELQKLTNVPAQNQRLMLKKRQLKDDGVVFNDAYKLEPKDKLMLIGTPLAELAMAVVVPTNVSAPALDEVAPAPKENIQDMSKHKKIIAKGLPEGAPVGNAMGTEPLPDNGLTCIYNNMGTPARVTFKDKQIVISTKERTEKYPCSSIGAVNSEPVEDRKGYHIVSLQMGKNDNSKYYLYYVPAQYIEALKQNVLGGFF
eukprot:TRINITY_DN2028_c0_g1_i4.p1 TRINITY_DN2028_c0_g1~~TRINITY_DN2028_c0_g1_i4.p1  ORF type:complete len:269 (-),score=63.35 TRINITY_DN2028_c0_g1_i4:207-1013(-)